MKKEFLIPKTAESRLVENLQDRRGTKMSFITSVLALIAVVSTFSNANATKYIITAEDFIFSPSAQNVQLGDTIRWEWLNGDHTTTSTIIPAGAAKWDAPLNSTNTFFEYIPTVFGTYNYKCSFHVSMGMIGTFTVRTPDGTPGINEQPVLKVFPNPCTLNLTVEFASGNSSLKVLKIYNVNGQILLEEPFEYSMGENQRIFNIPDFIGRGLLYFQFIDDAEHVYTQRVIKL